MSADELKRAAKEIRILRRKLERSEDNRRHLEEIDERNSNIFRNLNAEVEQANAQLAEARAEADAANQAKSAFLASMSHEIRTPMNAILGFAEILAGLIREPAQREYLEAIRTSGNSLLGLINDILDLSKVEAGKLELEFKPCDAAGICRDMGTIFGQKAFDKGIDLTIDVAEDFPEAVVLDELRLRQILINLIGNAIKFTDTGGVTLRAQSDAQGTSTDLTFAVIDSGLGIPADQIDHIFGAFEQTRGQSAAKFGGTGLGLAISKKLAQMMGGDIRVESDLGKGSVFFVELAGVGTTSQERISAHAEEKAIDVRFEPGTVLVIDDNAYSRMLVRTYLADTGLEIAEAENGQEGLDSARRKRPDVVLMDVAMPQVGGAEATQALRGDDQLKDVPVIVITAAAMKEEENLLRQISDAYLAKPVSRSQLIGELRRFLPHEEQEGGEEGAGASGGRWTPADLSDAQRAELPLLHQQLEEARPLWQELVDTQTITDIEVFASRMREAGHRFGYGPLESWGERLSTQAALFDMAALPGTLEEFPGHIDELSALLED